MCMMREKTHSSLLSCFFIFQVILQHISFSHFFSFLFFLIHILFSLSFPPPSTSSITSYGISNGAIRFLQQFLYYNQSPIIKLSYHIQKQLRLFQYYCSLFHTSLLDVDFPTNFSDLWIAHYVLHTDADPSEFLFSNLQSKYGSPSPSLGLPSNDNLLLSTEQIQSTLQSCYSIHVLLPFSFHMVVGSNPIALQRTIICSLSILLHSADSSACKHGVSRHSHQHCNIDAIPRGNSAED